MDIETKIAGVNPMVVLKLKAATETIAAAKEQLKTGIPEVKFSDLYKLRAFLMDRKFGTLAVGLTGPLRSNEFLSRIHSQYVAKNITPNCSIEQVLKCGGKVSLDLELSDFGKSVLKRAKTRAAELVAREATAAKPKRVKTAKLERVKATRPPPAKVPSVQGAAEISSSKEGGLDIFGAAEAPADPSRKVQPAWANQ